ncbi:PTS mannose/fructose/sorbose transporter subunit IIB [Leuconostoc pseudomesenteroides]|jgi:PTS system mannose-specific IIB component|uniref:PTS sugar transporter subunit IIB n=1 Tax=Leuconostoc falkenbergense TaxID=2766470 RepID=UPI000E090EF0|nr:PTS sugar transporter subunit IIB [Leuconostoc falkenbergense]MCT4410876.1 PTS mannose/fructose/sorbose transporter subunit IIB [Leuconostoc falkenbergense]MDV3545405.1 PTS sugar transporter subunit IIB [Leuconostoc falkenbergense]RDG17749.1 PTS mannose/fructose/sorbose transporter subunit IIB [Leuconostoc pseudomesenteroides]VTU70521.1 PTS family mannose/fructose/sorbose porter component IIB [Lactobacillus plantarum subsp. plantarum ST-III] [Leuconostoc pseudomesenteroides]
MSVILARVDQRLIHGIVVTQWAAYTKAKRLMVVDDEVSQDETMKAGMKLSKPAGTSMSIINTETAINNFKMGKYDNHTVFLLVKEPKTLVKLIENGVKIPKVNLGIIFNQSGKKQFTKMVAMDEQEQADVKKIQSLDVPVTFHYVPNEDEKKVEIL